MRKLYPAEHTPSLPFGSGGSGPYPLRVRIGAIKQTLKARADHAKLTAELTKGKKTQRDRIKAMESDPRYHASLRRYNNALSGLRQVKYNDEQIGTILSSGYRTKAGQRGNPNHDERGRFTHK